MTKLEEIVNLIKNQNELLHQLPGIIGNDMFGEDPFSEADYETPGEVIEAPQIGATRTRVVYRTRDGHRGEKRINDLDPRIQQVIQLSMEQGVWFEVYERPDGSFGIAADEVIVNQISMQTPYDNAPDAGTRRSDMLPPEEGD